MAFSIYFTDSETDEFGLERMKGEVFLEDDNEGLYASLTAWNAPHYEAQWRDAIARILKDEESKALLCTDFFIDPDGSPETDVTAWVLYRTHDTVRIREMVFMEALEPTVSFDDLQKLAPDYREDKEVSEWHVSVDDLRKWLQAQSVENGEA